MFFEVLSLTYHSPITIESLIYGVLFSMRQYSSAGHSPRSLECHRRTLGLRGSPAGEPRHAEVVHAPHIGGGVLRLQSAV
jgi:hypothetical protein